MSLKSTFKSMFIAKEEERARLLQEQEMQEAAQQFFDKELRTVSVRLDPFILAQIDGLAQYLEESRQTILDQIIREGTKEAIEGYGSVFSDQDEFLTEFFNICRQAAREGKTFKEVSYQRSNEEH
jgi:hypothetical protein